MSPIITADALDALMGDKTLKLFDVRGTWATPAGALPEKYDAGHIKGAFYLDWTKDFLEQGVPLGQAAVAPQKEAEAAFGRLGINDGDKVVIYDDMFHMFSGRIWWSMRYWGFKNVRVLSGGWENWKATGRAISTEPTTPTKGSFAPVEQPQLRVDLSTFIAQRETSCVMDGRGADGYAGNPDDPRSGHIPGAISLPFKSLLDDTNGTFLPDAEMAAIFDAQTPNWRTTPVISSCGSGYTATVLILAMEHLGINAPLYDGSFAEWKQDPNRPVAQL